MNETRPRVLYVDDDAGLCRLAEIALGRRGYEVVTASSGEEGVRLASESAFDLVAIDHYMPGMDGLETLARLRALPTPPPVVYVTGSEEGRIAVAALKAGAVDYVVKTIGEDFHDLLDTTFRGVLTREQLTRDKAAAEAGLRDSNIRLEALLREVNHRVANSLQLVSAMVQLQARALADEAARAALADTQNRISAVAQVHRRLYTSDNVESVDMREYLGALVDELHNTWSSGGCRRVVLSAEPIEMPTDRAVSLGVIVNELVSNACKYAYGADQPGEVRVELIRQDGEFFVLAVEDDGVGMVADAPPRGTGVGTRVISAMAKSLKSAIEYDLGRPGVRATLKAALR